MHSTKFFVKWNLKPLLSVNVRN